MFFYILTNYYNQKLFFGQARSISTLKDYLRKNKSFKYESKNKFSKVVYLLKVDKLEIAEELIEEFKNKSRPLIDDIITTVNKDWKNLI